MAEKHLLILKLTSAQRQLDASIRMRFAEEDILAVTTVTAAAYRVLRDIKANRGQETLSEQLRDGVLGAARAYARGELEDSNVKFFQQSDEIWNLITEAAQLIQAAGVEKDMLELNSILKVSVPPNTERHYWKQKNAVANFLKHADTDPQSVLNLEEVNAHDLISEACGVYFDLMGSLTPEMEIWTAATFLKNNVPFEFPPISTIMDCLRATPPEDQNRVCLALVLGLKQKGGLPTEKGPL